MSQRKAIYDIWYDTADGKSHFLDRKAGGHTEVQRFARSLKKTAYINFVEYA